MKTTVNDQKMNANNNSKLIDFVIFDSPFPHLINQ